MEYKNLMMIDNNNAAVYVVMCVHKINIIPTTGHDIKVAEI